MLTSRPYDMTSFDLHLFGEGRHFELYRLLGAHPHSDGGENGYRFAVWAPNARAVMLKGEFNDWGKDELKLYPQGASGVWSAFVPGVGAGQLYKYAVHQASGAVVDKADPLGLAGEYRPGTASITAALPSVSRVWQDEAWMNARAQGDPHGPLSIYEVHAGSWKRHQGPEHAWRPFYSYAEMVRDLVPYVRDMGFTHIEFMPLAEHPLDQSWGYQTGQYYAPSARFGTPEDLCRLIEACHQAGLGVILDWVPAHFPKDSFALGRFDGTALYEHADPRQGEHPDWGTYIFNYGRNEVRNFLLANALYWIKEFHFDGLRLDAVSSMLYLDYSRKPGGWVPNRHGGRENLEAIAFLKELNTTVRREAPGVITLAEESTSWDGVSRPVDANGLGFDYKWNMGWMHDSLRYFSRNPATRRQHHNELSFSLCYAFSENFLLPLSHDEVVHGKGSLLNKLPGNHWQKKAGLRLLYAYMWAHPGKKLLFMGGEFGQWREWSESAELDWALLGDASHQGLQCLVRDLNLLLRSEKAMHAADDSWNGFSWVSCSDANSSIYSFARKAPDAAPLLWVFNCSPSPRNGYRLSHNLPQKNWQVVLNTDSRYYGGGNSGSVQSCLPDGLLLSLPPLSALALKAA